MPNLVVPDQQVVAGVASTLEWTYLDENGEGASPPSTITVGITRADGTTLVAAGTATTTDTAVTGRRTYTLSATNSATLDVLTVSWTMSGTVIGTTLVEIVGGFLFTVKEARDSHPKLVDSSKYPTTDIVKYRLITDSELTWICDRAFTPRFRRITVDGSGTYSLTLPSNDLRAVSAVSVSGTAYSAGEIADLKVYENRRVDQTLGNVWEYDQENVVVAYTFGLDRPYPDLKEAALERFRELLWAKSTGIPRNATSVQDGNGNSIPLAAPGDFETGNRMVDSVYRRYSLRTSAGTDGKSPAAFGRTVSYPPSGRFRGLRL